MLAMLGFAIAIACPQATPSGWAAGTARVSITPEGPIWMAGYAARTKPSEGKTHDLWAKSLAIKDPTGSTAVLVTLDLCGIGPDISNPIRDQVQARYGLDRSRIVLASSHTHSGPVVGSNLITMYRLEGTQRKTIDDYARRLIDSVVEIVGKSLRSLAPADLTRVVGRSDFAVNRRANKEKDVPALRAAGTLVGPVDHDVPVLQVGDREGRLLAVVFGYACHCTVLDGYQLSGDYAGFASAELEKAHPGALALFVAGCGADQNPIPRRSPELADLYGKKLSASVDKALAGPVERVEGRLFATYEEVPLKFAKLPTPSQLETDAQSKDFFTASRAQSLRRRLDGSPTKTLSPTYPYPVQAWRLGDLTWIFLGGEVVVDYSIRIKAEAGASPTWVSAYCNDVMAYIPSLRVLREGGYEGSGAMLYYGLPSPWGETVEDDVRAAVKRRLSALPSSR